MNKLKLQHSINWSNTSFLATQLPSRMPGSSDTLLRSYRISQNCKQSKVGVGQKTSMSLVVGSKIYSRGESTRYCTIAIILPRELTLVCWSANMMNLSMKCQSHFITLAHPFVQLLEGSISSGSICWFDSYIQPTFEDYSFFFLLSEIAYWWITFLEC